MSKKLHGKQLERRYQSNEKKRKNCPAKDAHKQMSFSFQQQFSLPL